MVTEQLNMVWLIIVDKKLIFIFEEILIFTYKK